MALTIALVKGSSHVAGNKKIRVRDITLDSSYPTGGYSLLPSDFGLKKIEHIQNNVAVASGGGATARTVAYDYTNQKLQVYTTASAEALNASDQSAFTVRLRAQGY